MVATLWGTEGLADFAVTTDGGDEFAPAIADSGGGSYGIAWTSAAGVTVRFYDVVGTVDPALGTIVLTSDATASNVSLTAGGAVGYAATWETASGALMGRYVGLAGPVGAAFQIDASLAGFAQHDAAMAGYAMDGADRKSAIDGFNVVWVSTDTVVIAGTNSQSLTQAQIDAGYGQILLQRYAVPLDSRIDPIGPPIAAGLDGIAVTDAANGLTNTDANAAVQIAAIGRDPSTIVTHDGETVITWIDLNNQVHLQVYDLAGNSLNAGIAIAGGGTLADVDGAAAASGDGVTAGYEAKVVDLAGSGFVVAWVGQETLNLPIGPGGAVVAVTLPEIRAVVFTPGAGAGTYTAGAPVTLEVLPVGFAGDFSLGTLVDSGGFSLSYTVATAAGKDVLVHTFDSNGVSLGAATQVNTTTLGDQSAVVLGSLIGDRIVAVYLDDPSAAPNDQNIRSAILDTRTLPDGSAIVANGAGLTISGDDGGNGRIKAIADQLIGTIGNDSLDGLQSDDELYGAVGNDTLAGGAGDDLLDGGAGVDVAVFSGNQADYTIDYLGGNLFTVTDNRGGVPDGIDTVRGVEIFRFADGDVTSVAIIGGIDPITPTAWGWTDEDGDSAPNAAGLPDVDGFLVNHAAAGNGDVDRNAFVADSVGEFIGVVWEHSTDGGATTHIQGQFYDVIGAFDAFMPNVVSLSDGIGLELNPVVVSGGANSGWGIAFEERDSALDDSSRIRTNFQGPGFLTGPELTVLDEGNDVDQHDIAMSGSFLDRTVASPIGGSVLPTGMDEGYNVVWVSTDLDPDSRAATNVAGDARYGRVMLQRFDVPLDDLGNPGAPVAGGIDGIAGLDDHTLSSANDGAVQVALAGRNPSTAALHTFETGIIWIEQNGLGGERVAGVVIDDVGGYVSVGGFSDISSSYTVASGTTAQIVSAGAVNFGIVWVTDQVTPGRLTVVGTMYSSPGTGLDGVGFTLGAPSEPFVLFDLPAGIVGSDLELSVTGISGEDSNDLVVSWKETTGGTADVVAQHVAVALDPITGIAIAMTAEGDAITVNASTDGNQDGATVAGLLGDRFVAVYHDDNANYTDGNDIVARIIDTRDAAIPDPITGDLIRNGTPQARRDVLIGTNGNDTITGDISDADGLVDYIFAGMGDDVIQGGPGLRGAAGIPEIIDGGEGYDIAVYTGRMEDYSITVNGDGSYEVIDLRPTANAAGTSLQHDGIDNLYGIERIRFLNLTQADPNPAVPPAATEIEFGFPGTPPPLNHIDGVDQGAYDGTPLVWSIDDTSQYKEIAVDVDPNPADPAGAKSGINVINLQDGAALAWISADATGARTEVWAISYDATGKPDPIFLSANTMLTDGSAVHADNLVGGIDIAMTGGLGFTAVWESTDVDGDDSGDTSLHLRFASTNTHVVLDPGGGVPGPGLSVDAATGASGEIVVSGSDGAGVADGAAIQGYEIVNVDNDTLEVGFHIGYVQKAGPADAFGELRLARYEIPVYEIATDPVTGLPVLDAAGQGQLATDAFGNALPSSIATFGVGSETAPISIGLDGLRGTADDGQAIVLTKAGLLAANDPLVGSDADHMPIQGRDISIGSLHDGQLVVTYIGTDDAVHLKIYVPSVDQTSDRETRGLGGADVVATGVTAYSELGLPATLSPLAGLGLVPDGQTAMVVPQQNGSFGVFWAEDADGSGSGTNVDIRGVIFSGAGTNWSPSPVVTLVSDLPAATHFQVAPTGVTPGGLEDGFFVSWDTASGIQGQRVDMTGATVGSQIVVGDPSTGTPSAHASAGIDSGLILVGYEDENGSVSAQYLDNREPGVNIIGPRTGAPRDVLVGTVGDDALDGRALDDELHGGLGNDLLTLGTGDDVGLGGLGCDTIIGGTGQDQLLGEDGDDLLWGGPSGPPDAKVDRELVDGLTNAGRLDLVAINTGADIVSGGAGIDTISFQGEFGDFNIDLATGVVLSDRDHDGGFVLEDVIGQLVDDGAGGTPFQFILDIENATGGIGNDQITGDATANVLRGGAGADTLSGADGNDFLEGGSGNDRLIGEDGVDTAVFDKSTTDLTIDMFSVDADGNWVVTTGGSDGTDTLVGIEIVDGTRFVLTGQSSGFATQAAAEASGQLLDGDVVLSWDGTSVTGTVFTNDNPHAPMANDAAATTLEDTAVVVDVVPSASDADANTNGLLISAESLVATHGTARVVDNRIEFTPDQDFAGLASVQYQVIDTPAAGAPRLSNVATVAIEVTAVNDAPAGVDDEGVATETTAASAGVVAVDNVLLNDIDPDAGDVHTVTNPGTYVLDFGTLVIGADGAFTYTPDDANPAVDALSTGDTLTDTFTYTMQDAAGLQTSAVLTLTIEGANDAPVIAGSIAAPVAASTVEPFSFTLPDGLFSDVDSALTLSVTLVDGRPLSAIGLAFDPVTETLSGKPLQQGDFVLRINAFDGETTVGQDFTLSVAGNAAPTIAVNGSLSFAENAANGTLITTLTVADPELHGARLLLVDDAGGRIQLVKNGANYQLQVAETLLIDHQLSGDANHGYTAKVLAVDGDGGTTELSLNLTATGVAENRVVAIGTAGADFVRGTTGKDNLVGNAGNDVYIVDNSGDKVTEAANGGVDTIYTSLSSFDLNSAANVENLIYTGSAAFSGKAVNAGSKIIGGGAGDKLQGANGNDVLSGLAGNDTLTGGSGNDTLSGGAGNDSLDGGAGTDTAAYGNAAGEYIASINAQNVLQIQGSAPLAAEGIDSLIGIETLLFADAAYNVVAGTTAANTLNGGGGRDLIVAGAGNDTLSGGNGDDMLIGEAGNDQLTGGAGADTFVFRSGTGNDRITDFEHGIDLIDVNGMFTDFADLAGHMVRQGNIATITLDPATVITVNTSVALEASDFRFA